MNADRRKFYYRVTLEFANSPAQDDIALKSESADDARLYAKYKTDEWARPPIRISVRRISKAVAEDIIESNGIDWAS
jgi:hypothetical protein